MKIQVYLTKEALYVLGLPDGSRETVHCFYFLQNWDHNRIIIFCRREIEM